MPDERSKSTLAYDEMRALLQTGRYLPAQHVDPNALARDLSISTTPVLYALYRLVGEGSIGERGREGFYIPPITSAALHDLYDWMQRLLLIACDIAAVPARTAGPEAGPHLRDADVVLATRDLFEAIALAASHSYLYFAVRQANDRLGPIRRVAQTVIPDADGELDELDRFWRAGRRTALKTALVAYHQRRQRLVPHIITALTDASSSELR
jgi:DNA-binding GntR family transcriptional regulator